METNITAKNYKPRNVEIIDTTLREGVQSPLMNDTKKFFFTQSEKLQIVEALIRYGVRFIELFSPVVSTQEKNDFKIIIKKRNELCEKLNKTCYILAHVRCHPKDVEEAIKAGADGLNIYIGTSVHSRTFNHGNTLDNIISRAKPILTQLRKQYPHIMIRFSGEDAFRTEEKDLFYVYDELSKYVDRLGTPDTVGVGTPQTVKQRISDLIRRYPKMPLEGHFHNDRGLSLINALTAVETGMSFINTSLLGLGERSGITSMSALLFNLHLNNSKFTNEYDIALTYPINVLAADMLDIQVPSTEPISLTNRTHSAGVHTGAQLKGSSVYEAHPLADFGVNETRLLLGPLSGSNIVRYYLRNMLYYNVPDAIVPEITYEFKKAMYKKKKKQTPAMVLKEVSKKYSLEKIVRPLTHEEHLE